jgi:CHRD domain-containing protein
MRKTCVPVLLLATLAFVAVALPAAAQPRHFGTRLRGFEEVPALATPAGGRFTATVNEDETEVSWRLEYKNLEAAVTQAHIHFGQMSVNGGISVFFCSNLGNGPAGTQACPNPGPGNTAVVEGTFTSSDVIGPNAQGLAPGELFSLIRAMRAGVAYANVHSEKFPGGEIRGQVRPLGSGDGQ